jgi:hypothetical protein
MAFDVFLSHNSKDKPAIRELAARLEAHGIRVWFDEDQLIPGRPWQALLEKGIEQSATGAVLVGSDGLGPWEDEEMQALLRHAAAEDKPVIPVLLPGARARPKLPVFLSNRTWVDLREGLSDQGVAKLVWGITGKRADAPTVAAAGKPRAAPEQAASRTTRTHIVVLALVAAAGLALAAWLVPWFWGPPDAAAEVFTIWVITESDGGLQSERHRLPLAEIAERRTPDAFIGVVGEAIDATGDLEDARIFRLADGTEIGPGNGDPLRGDNRAVLVVPAARVAGFPDPETAFTFFRSQLPND